MFNFIFGLKEKLIAVGLFLVLVFGYITKIKWQAKREGQKEVIDQLNKETKRKEDEWKKIDDTPSDVDSAISELRERAKRHGR